MRKEPCAKFASLSHPSPTPNSKEATYGDGQGVMRVKLRVLGVPLHPLLVHFPIAFWLVVPLLDLAVLFAGPEPWWALAQNATILGVVMGAAAIAVGLLEYLQPSLVGIDLKLAARHGIRTTMAWCVFTTRAVVVAFLPLSEWSMTLCLALDLIGCVLLIQGIYFGTRQVYQQLEEE
jgi:uncharacterized membrane protein